MARFYQPQNAEKKREKKALCFLCLYGSGLGDFKMDGASPGLVKFRHSYRCQGIIGAHLRPGYKPGQNPVSNGDCIILDFENRFFGLSDSSDRDPGASKRFLVQFDRLLSSIAPKPNAMQTFGSKDLKRWIDGLARKTNSLLLDLKGNGSCTFTGLHILNTSNGCVSVLMHTGDSALYEFVPNKQKLFRKTENNFWMVGRTDKLYQVATLEFDSKSIFIMTTDGMPDLRDASTSAPKEKALKILCHNAVEDIPRKLITHEILESGLHDDVAVIAIAPQKLIASNRKILIEQ
jgi:hypothetical protein